MKNNQDNCEPTFSSKAVDAAKCIQRSVQNLPFTNMAIAGLLGAGAIALMAACKTTNQKA